VKARGGGNKTRLAVDLAINLPHGHKAEKVNVAKQEDSGSDSSWFVRALRKEMLSGYLVMGSRIRTSMKTK
jgi:hypothetical protein